MSKVEVEMIVKYILDHPSTLMWYRWYLNKRYHRPFFSESYSFDFRQKGVPVDVDREKEVMVLVPLYTMYGVRGSDIIFIPFDKIRWTDGDIAFFGNWRFYGKFAWAVATKRRHPLKTFVIHEMEKEAKIRGSGNA